MPILRHNHEQEFTILPNSLIRNPELSLRDMGLLCYMLSLPPDWEFSINGLDAVIRKNGASSVKAALRILEKQGYLVRNQGRGGTGRFQCNQWMVSDLPLKELEDILPSAEKPSAEKPSAEKPSAEKPPAEKPPAEKPPADNPPAENHLQTKNISNKVNTNKEKREQKAPSIPVLQDIKAYIQENGLSVDAEQFYDYYTARGWMLSGTQIVDWTALLRNWERRERKEGVHYGKQNPARLHEANRLELPWKLSTEL